MTLNLGNKFGLLHKPSDIIIVYERNESECLVHAIAMQMKCAHSMYFLSSSLDNSAKYIYLERKNKLCCLLIDQIG